MKEKKSKFKEEKNIRYKSRLKINLNLNLVNSQVCPKMLVGRPLSNPINSGSWPIPLSKLATNHSANCQIPLSKQAGHASPSTGWDLSFSWLIPFLQLAGNPYNLSQYYHISYNLYSTVVYSIYNGIHWGSLFWAHNSKGFSITNSTTQSTKFLFLNTSPWLLG